MPYSCPEQQVWKSRKKPEANQKSPSISFDNRLKSTVFKKQGGIQKAYKSDFLWKQYHWIYVHGFSRFYNITTYHGQDYEDWVHKRSLSMHTTLAERSTEDV